MWISALLIALAFRVILWRPLVDLYWEWRMSRGRFPWERKSGADDGPDDDSGGGT